MQDKKRMWAWIGVVIVLGIILIFVWPGHQGGSPASTAPAPVYAAPGQLVSSFPQSLVLNVLGANATSSYSIAYSSSTNQSTGVFNSPNSVTFIFNTYRQYFIANGWNITNAIDASTSTKGLYATNGSSSASVSIVAAQQGTGSQVTIGYLGQ